MSRTASKSCELKKEGAECKKEKIPRKENMDKYKKMQCWMILKRLMVGRDDWTFKQIDVKVLEFLDNPEAIFEPIDLKNIEYELNKCLYSAHEEFVDDMRLVFSYVLLYPSRSEIHRIF
ncbi:transcription factor GTE12-like [Gastrolobium bilobum]|uniref:transcription factor GTE12-like n=1 Tax=Gastrolobium bilobum TaxID=150636 RepID=UPI002AB1CD78|nr:transcription factor GTE12-like [Gastrolobium bilobum]